MSTILIPLLLMIPIPVEVVPLVVEDHREVGTLEVLTAVVPLIQGQAVISSVILMCFGSCLSSLVGLAPAMILEKIIFGTTTKIFYKENSDA